MPSFWMSVCICIIACTGVKFVVVTPYLTFLLLMHTLEATVFCRSAVGTLPSESWYKRKCFDGQEEHLAHKTAQQNCC